VLGTLVDCAETTEAVAMPFGGLTHVEPCIRWVADTPSLRKDTFEGGHAGPWYLLTHDKLACPARSE